jgi:hypothetical protein
MTYDDAEVLTTHGIIIIIIIIIIINGIFSPQLTVASVEVLGRTISRARPLTTPKTNTD